jgi:ABC-2 type transport system permease protein
MRDTRAGIVEAAHVEWTKLRSLPSTVWAVLAAVALTLLLSALVCSSVDTSGGGPNCTPGAPGCGDEDVVLNSLSGIYLGQIAIVAVAVLAITSEYATGTVRATFAANPRRRMVLLAKAGVVGAMAFTAGLVASIGSFLIGQPLLHGNGFTPANGYPIASLGDGPTVRAVMGTALYVGAIAILGLGLGAILRRTAATISFLLSLLFIPMIVALMLPDPIRGNLQKFAPMTAGLSIQRTVERFDSVPIEPWAGLAVACVWAAAALLGALWLIRSRDA